MYDSFVVRDSDGFSGGIMLYPWFSNAGSGRSRSMVLRQSDAVPVRSCWGGIAAFDASMFQIESSNTQLDAFVHQPISEFPTTNHSDLSLSFRSAREAFWEASECCLVFADMEAAHGLPDSHESNGVFINPYVRVAYSEWTWKWLPFFRRFERSFQYYQYLVTAIFGPEYNPRRLHKSGDVVRDSVWTPKSNEEDEVAGHFKYITRSADPGGFCGQRRMFVMKRNLEAANSDGSGKNWEKIPVPYGADL